MIKSILIPINDSENNSKALRYGALMAMRMGKPIQLLKIISPQWIPATPPVGAPGVASGISPLNTAIQTINREDLMQEAEKEVAKVRENLLGLTRNKIEINTQVVQGEAAYKIHDHIQQHPEELLVIGQEDSPTGMESLIGNTTTSLLGDLDTPMIVVPEETPFHNIRRVLYLAEELGSLNDTVNKITQLDPTVQPYIHVVLSYSGSENMSDWDTAELTGTILNEIQYPHVGLEIRGEKDLYKLAQAKLEKQPVDLVAIHHRSRNFLLERFYMPNAARKLAFQTDLPLLILPDAISE